LGALKSLKHLGTVPFSGKKEGVANGGQIEVGLDVVGLAVQKVQQDGAELFHLSLEAVEAPLIKS
jgi:hypothetical protein